jgi:tripartite-type tricarboxylate transporter receptor subunit TctC
MRPRGAGIAIVLLAACLAWAPAGAADFYQGKTLTLIAGFAPGGGVDLGARLIARHIGRFIPGKPVILVQNMPGAAGLVAANHIFARAAADGLTLAVPGREWPLAAALGEQGALYDPLKLAWIGSSGAGNELLWLRADSGVTSLAALKASPRKIVVGGLGRTTPTASVPLLMAAEGLPLAVVPGYDATASILLALEQKEVSGLFTQESTFGRRHDLIDKGVILPVLQTEAQKPGLPLIDAVIPPARRPLLKVLSASVAFGLPLVGPPAMPEERVALLRNAFLAMAQDREFQADALTISEPVGYPIDGASLAKLVADSVAAATPEVVEGYKKLTGKP